jgi:hypothetical protein
VTGEARIGTARIPKAAAIGRIPGAAGQFVDTNQWESPNLLAEGLVGPVGARRHDLSQPLSLGGFAEIFNLKYKGCRVIDGPAGLLAFGKHAGPSVDPRPWAWLSMTRISWMSVRKWTRRSTSAWPQ